MIDWFLVAGELWHIVEWFAIGLAGVTILMIVWWVLKSWITGRP